MPTEVNDALKVTEVNINNVVLKFAEVDLNDMMISRAAEQALPFSHAIEASVWAATASAIHSAGELLKRRSQDGSEQIIRYLDDTNAVIEETSGRRIGYITFDREKNLEHVRLADGGFTYTIDIDSGDILDKDGKLIGKISEGNDGKKLLVGRDNKVFCEI